MQPLLFFQLARVLFFFFAVGQDDKFSHQDQSSKFGSRSASALRPIVFEIANFSFKATGEIIDWCEKKKITAKIELAI